MYRLLIILGLFGLANTNGLGLDAEPVLAGSVNGLFGNDYLIAVAIAIGLQPWLAKHLE